MAAATVTKAPQTLRRRRPSLNGRHGTRSTHPDGPDASERRKVAEPLVRGSDYILRKFRGRPPSLTIHLHPTHFRFDQQDGSFSYDSPMKAFLQHLRRQTVPHEFIQELLDNQVPFYDGCLIVQVFDHKSTANKTPSTGNLLSASADDCIPFSMHNYHEHITPSPLAPYPRKPSSQPSASSRPPSSKQPDQDKEKQPHDGPRITTLVLHPTPLSRHHEIMALASTPKTIMDKQGGGLNEKDYHDFEAELLVTTEPPLLLAPATSPAEAAKALDLLKHPLHSEPPPSPKARKRTHAEMAADDAQAAEEERRMLIMDERTKPSLRNGTAMSAAEGQTASVAIGFSRFKTLETIKKSHEENERKKKEEEAQKGMEKRQQDAQLAQKRKLEDRQRQEQAAMQAKQQQLMRQQQIQQQQQQQAAQQQAQQQQQQAAQQQAQQQAQHQQHVLAQAPNHQQQQLQQQMAAAHHTSPIVRNPTPMMASSPLMANSAAMGMGGFPMQPTPSNQGAGSPPRPPSAVQHANIAMARQMSQQQSQSRHATPQMAHNTPHMAASVPMDVNRQMSGTPQLQHRSPIPPHMQGTPSQAMMGGTPQMNQQQLLTPTQQMAMMQQQNRARMQAQAMHGSPAQSFTPEQMVMMRNQQNMAIQQQQMNPQAYAQMQARMQQMNNMQGGGGTPMMQNLSGQQMNNQQMPQNNQANQRMQMAQQIRAQFIRTKQLVAQFQGSGQAVPPELQQQYIKHSSMLQSVQAQMTAAVRSSQNLGDPNNTEQYMHNLRNQQALIARMQRNPQQGMNAGMMNGGQNMGMNMMQQNPQMQQMRNQQANVDLAQQFAARQNALNQQRPGSGMG